MTDRMRIRRGETIVLRRIGSVNNTLRGNFLVEYDGQKGVEPVPLIGTSGGITRVIETDTTTWEASHDGYVTRGIVYADEEVSGIRRGELYVDVRIQRRGSVELGGRLCRGYLYTSNPVSLGQDIEPGPGGGEGNRNWVALATDEAPADVTRVLAATNAHRRIHGFVWYYNCAAVVASRTLQVLFTDPGLALPTGFANVPFVWYTASQTLTTGEEGIVYANEKMTAYNDNSTRTVDSTATAPNPFPITVTEEDLAELFFDVGAAEATDRHSIYIDQEEWLVIE